jgi:2-octaprenylphenol hydroxylase
MNSDRVDLAIIGGGMTGLSLACAMSGAGLSILVVDAYGPGEQETLASDFPSGSHEFDSGYAARVSTINLAAEALLEQTAAWQHLDKDRLGIFSRMSVWDGEGTGATEFDCASLRQDHLGYVIENRIVLQALLSRIEELDDVEYIAPLFLEGIDLEWDIEAADRADRSLNLKFDDSSSVTASLIIGADGSNSTVRKMLQFETREWSYAQAALVTTVRTELAHQHTAWQCFTSQGPLAFLPLANENLSSIVWSVDPGYCEQLLNLDSEAFCDQVGRAFEHRLGQVVQTDRRFSFPLNQGHAKRYVQHGVALAGDAAHTIHPLAGQGINLGFKDVTVLSQELHRAIRRGIGIGAIEVLERYERRRMGDNLAMMAAMEGFKFLYGRSEPGINWLRNTGMKLFDESQFIKRFAIRIATGQ